MGSITSGTVSFEDGIKKPEEYAPPRKVRVELSFAVELGQDFTVVLDAAGSAAQAEVYKLLGLTPAAATKAPKPAKIEKVKTVEPTIDMGKHPDTIILTEPAASVDLKKDLKDSIVMEEPKVEAKAPEVKPADAITDVIIYDMIVKANAKMKGAGDKDAPKKITGLIEKHCPKDGVPANAKRIPMDKRPDFAADLELLLVAG